MVRWKIAAVVVASLAGFAMADIVRESTGARRATLDAMELRNLPPEAWPSLTAWANGSAPTAEELDGKPVLLVMWASWHPASLKALPLAQKMADKFAGQGLIVVGAHHPQGFEDAVKAASERGVTFRIAHDKDGAFRAALKVDHQPEYYVLDRAGHLRYASVAAASVEEACAEVCAETSAQASDVPKIRKEREQAALRAAGRTESIRAEIDLSGLPPLPPGYTAPEKRAYEWTEWPKIEEESGKQLGLLDQQGKRVEVRLGFSPTGFFPSKPEVQGRGILIYFWHPDVLASFDKVMDQMDLLQQKHSRDLAVYGALVTKSTLESQNSGQGQGENLEELALKGRQFMRSRNYKHTLAVDLASTAMASLGGQGQQKLPVPGAIVVSSDGVIRWAGSVRSPSFRTAVDTILANDPGIARRRAADLEYIRSREK
ncbi:MAG: TlpA family protein disulfide reductase [Phycisphaerae bacterium]|nr:TlpA family protein disulfide reductase [Phycisphaerae bacterium]